LPVFSYIIYEGMSHLLVSTDLMLMLFSC